jgi:hypothetical protein
MGIDLNNKSEHESHELNTQVLLTLMGYGLLALVCGLVASRVVRQEQIYLTAGVSQVWSVVCFLGAMVASDYGLKWLAVGLLGGLGVADTLNNISVNVVTQAEFPNRLEPYSLFRLVNPFSTSFLYLLQAGLSQDMWGVGGYLVLQASIAAVLVARLI